MTVRKTTTLATCGGIALVVFVFSAVMMLSEGVKRTLGSTGKDDVAIVIRKGSDVELSSAVDTPQVGLVLASPEVKHRADGKPDGVGEVLVVITADKVGTAGVSNVQTRGISEDAFEFRPEVKIIEGRKARPGSDECVIGRAIRGRFKGLDLGQSFELRKNRPLKVVGVFDSGGSGFESEVWADVDAMRSAFGREGTVQSVRARLKSASLMPSFERSVESNRQLGLEVISEREYYEKQSEGTAKFINTLGMIVAFFFAVGAMIGAMITMYAAVANRKREIGTLRALGFGKVSIMFSFLLESVLLALLGGALGAAGSLAMGLVTFSMVNFQSWSEVVFTFEPTMAILGGALVFGGAMGFLGGFFPAVRAARMPLVHALKD
jgi:putative ABC transport system permease protein